MSMPLSAPLYPLRWGAPELRQLSVICETKEERIREILDCTPFEFVSTMFQIHTVDLSRHTLVKNAEGLGKYIESAIVVPAKYGDYTSGYIAYMYVSLDSPLCAGREMFGYPKKMAKVEYVEKENKVRGITERGGVGLIDISCKLTDDREFEVPYPFLEKSTFLYKVIPSCEKNGVPLRQVIYRPSNTTTPDKLTSRKYGDAKVSLGRSDADPIYRLEPTKVLGGFLTVGDYVGAYGKVLASL